MSTNVVVITGRLTRDPEAKSLSNGATVVNFSIANNSAYKAGDGSWKEQTTFVDCELWGSRGEAFAKKCSKGSQVLVRGALKTESWEAQDGSKRSRLVVKVDGFETFNLSTKSQDEPVAAGVSESPAKGKDIPF